MGYNLLYKSERFPDGFISPAQVTDYLRCPACYEAARILKIPRPVSIHFAIGDALHRSVQEMRSGRVTQATDLWDVAADTFENRISQPLDEDGRPIDQVKEIELGQIESLGKAKDLAIAVVRYALPRLHEVDRARGEILATEVWLDEISTINPFPFPVKGKVDCIYENHLIEDLKSSGKSPDKKRGPDFSTGVQLAMYMLCLPGYHGVVDVAVKTQKPDLLSYKLVDPSNHFSTIYDLVVDVAERISAGDFPPRPSWQCSYVHDFPTFQASA